MSIKKSHAKCDGCGGMLVYDPKNQNLVCKNCHTQTEIIKENSSAKKDYSDFITTSKRSTSYTNCFNCGAKLEVKEQEITKTCPYCESNFVIDNKDLSGLTPDLIIPFQFNKESAIEKYKTNVKKKNFLPNKFKKSPNLDSIWGTYIPIFSFDANTFSNYEGVLETDHTRTDSNGRRYTYTTSKSISGSKSLYFTDILVESSSQTVQENLEGIKPFNFDAVSSYVYNADFIRGYNVDTYNNDLKNCKVLSEDIIKDKIKRIILSEYSYSRVRYFNLSTSFSDYKYAYVLVPVYFIGFTFKKKDYKVYLNGQTGKLGGNLPKSGWKIAFTVLLPVLIIASIILAVNLLA